MTINKPLSLRDALGVSNEHTNFKTCIKAWYTDTGEVLFTTHNIMTLAGGGFLARLLFDVDDTEKTPSYNSMLDFSFENSEESNTSGATEKVCLFCVGTDGCGRENSQVYAAKYASWINPSYTDTYGGIIPFRYTTPDSDLTASQRDYTKNGTYFGRKAKSDRIAYYFKRFDSDPILTQQFTDGTPIDANVYETQESTDMEVETIVSMQMSISKDDCRDFFFYGTGLNDARINSISLCTGYIKTDGMLSESVSNAEYMNIRPVTRLNFPNESLIDLRKSITISYSIYF
jgi:hypothetical protein